MYPLTERRLSSARSASLKLSVIGNQYVFSRRSTRRGNIGYLPRLGNGFMYNNDY